MRRSRLRPIALSKQKDRALYVKEARAFIAQARAEKRYCPVELFHGRKKLPVDVHHIQGRGPFLRDQSTWLAVSRAGHDFIHQNGRFARAKGWLK